MELDNKFPRFAHLPAWGQDLKSRQLSVWEHLKDLLSQPPLFYQQQRNLRCLLREELRDIRRLA